MMVARAMQGRRRALQIGAAAVLVALSTGAAVAQPATGAPPPACFTVKPSTRIEQFTLNVWPVIVIENKCETPYAVSWCRQTSLPGAPKVGECTDTTGDDVEVLSGGQRIPYFVLPGQTVQMDAWPMETAYAVCPAQSPAPDAPPSRRLGPYQLSPACPLAPSGSFAAWADPKLNTAWREDTTQAGRWTQPTKSLNGAAATRRKGR